jgi:hypothetical protein
MSPTGQVRMLQARVFEAVGGPLLRRACVCPAAALGTRAPIGASILGGGVFGLRLRGVSFDTLSSFPSRSLPPNFVGMKGSRTGLLGGMGAKALKLMRMGYGGESPPYALS